MTNHIDENEQRFLLELFKQTQGDVAGKISMYDVGSALDMDKDTSKRAAESLIGWNLAEVRTLSGAIGITADGLEEARNLGADPGGSGRSGSKLGNTVILGDAARQGIEELVATLKNQTGHLGVNFDVLTELVADLKTIDAQLTSSKPKTAIIRECFCSLRAILENAGANDSAAQIRGMLGE